MGVFTMQGQPTAQSLPAGLYAQGIPCCSSVRFGTPPLPQPEGISDTSAQGTCPGAALAVLWICLSRAGLVDPDPGSSWAGPTYNQQQARDLGEQVKLHKLIPESASLQGNPEVLVRVTSCGTASSAQGGRGWAAPQVSREGAWLLQQRVCIPWSPWAPCCCPVHIFKGLSVLFLRRGPQHTRQYPPVVPKTGGREAPPNSQAACSTLSAPLSASGEHPATAPPQPPRQPAPSHSWPGALETSESHGFPEESGLEGWKAMRASGFFFPFLLAITPPWLN
ncbi:PREDICTED: uncharacterized protein LOC105600299 [Cercocebus atys]|uniref:uncharacterized protein LOC105600299 n=1 Tax=Cercocebus atys TaxID=9531 RepID=UPI0005F379D2|nr:PREDICTED: uncharacterized protein LOC105600299 [Cercocebus atys]